MPLTSDDVIIGSFEETARAATGTAIVIDVFRAFTTGAVALANGADRIIMTGDLDDARTLRDTGAGAYCMGERHGVAPEGFDFGNSPAQIAGRRFDGQVLIQTTSNGTRGVLAADGAARVYAASFACAGATVRAVLADPVLPVTVVAMGDAGPLRRDEDEVCALYLRALLCGRRPDPNLIGPLLQSMADLRDTRKLTQADVAACVQVDSVDFAIRVTRDGARAIAVAERP